FRSVTRLSDPPSELPGSVLERRPRTRRGGAGTSCGSQRNRGRVSRQLPDARAAGMKLFDLKNAGHWPTLLAAFLYFDFSFMVWTVLGPLGRQIGEKLNLSPEQKGLMVALPILAGAVLRILLGVAAMFYSFARVS